MPICDNPDAVGYYWLPADAEKPIELRPFFLVKFITRKEEEAYEDEYKEALMSGISDIDRLKQLWAAIGGRVKGWRNFNDAEGKPLEFTLENLKARLHSRTELYPFFRNWMSCVQLSSADQKKLEPQSAEVTV